MLAATITFTFHLPLANELFIKYGFFPSVDLRTALVVFVFEENQNTVSFGFYVMAKGMSLVPRTLLEARQINKFKYLFNLCKEKMVCGVN